VENRETEIKLRVDHPALLKSRLRSLNAKLIRRRHFEDNLVLDFPNGSMRRRGVMLRLRRTDGKVTLTFKGPGRVVSRTKVRLELETEVSDGDSMLRVLKMMGLRCAFRYQKYRTIYRKGKSLITLDETPIGNYAEVEGPRSEIKILARRIGFLDRDFITATYSDLFKKYKSLNHSVNKHMIFGIMA
jgi:adenylate cyclase, class 2